MKSQIKSTLFIFTLYFIAIFLVSFILQYYLPNFPISSRWPYILAFLYVFTIIAFVILLKFIESRISMFANAFMLVNFGKLILFTAIILIYAWFNRSEAISFTITFFVYYLILTTYEIIALLRIQKMT
ncbi:MAG: hypothetical protein HN336_09455 [Lentimicrobiaceae bacterium]|jgi:hypothetical protein|nr:hypothetical protein [Lentimicrobiaceae bacterium]MCP4909403.1 hypothetical protein [Bacteroidota bacterium]MBT3455104.1 hypothetical protein [Lentimicrobiaceae bacterium]MBT3817995.1 hypothetical protein [Lentimicrobiaceae bacterium]MBT4062373.1 hypothetical protein [Lentimicrobiaceae bacterium]